MHKLTVFMTVYNIAGYLPRFFKCMADQTMPDYKLLIIDDGSEDESLEICRKQQDKDDRIEIVHIEHVGISAARNLVLSLIETPFAASVDADDLYGPDYLKHLVDAQVKYDADLVISKVIYLSEVTNKTRELPDLGEMVFDRSSFSEMLPVLLEDERLNYLYGKLYRTEYLKGIRVEEDVEQGSDTMINCQYLERADKIVVIDDADTTHIMYSSRSVTSYKGKRMYQRLYRIQKVLLSSFQRTGYLTPEMQRVIDKRIFQSLSWSLDGLAIWDMPLKEKLETANEMACDPLYVDAYDRQKKRGDPQPYDFYIIDPKYLKLAYFQKLFKQKVKKLLLRLGLYP